MSRIVPTRAMRSIELSIEGMTCAACTARVEGKLNKLDGVRASVNYAAEKANVEAPAGVAIDELVAGNLAWAFSYNIAALPLAAAG